MTAVGDGGGRPAATAVQAVGAAVGPGRVLTLAYAFFVLAAGARSGVQLATHAAAAPLPYGLSAVAAVVYLVGAVVVARADVRPAARPAARRWVLLELGGVVVVGAASVFWPAGFPDATVWSGFGSGYGYVPLVLPLLALAWLWWLGRRPAGR